ncbi:unnamed protein product, partial [Didymodactylos carnosus]
NLTPFQMQDELQRVLKKERPQITEISQYQPVAALDEHGTWNRAIVTDVEKGSSPIRIRILFVDVGHCVYVSRNNIRPLPQVFCQKAAFAIRCRLHDICPLNGTGESQWASNDPLHAVFSTLMPHSATAIIRNMHDNFSYSIDIEMPDLGDLATYLVNERLASKISMRSQQPPYAGDLNSHIALKTQQQLPQTSSYLPHTISQTSEQQRQTLQQQNVQPEQRISRSQQAKDFNMSSRICQIPTCFPENGPYVVTCIFSPTEFYACSDRRLRELERLSSELERIYSNQNMDLTLSVALYLEGTARREGESRVLVQCVDRGDQLVVDTSELLAIDEMYCRVPQFAQPFRLRGYDERQINANLTRKLKKMILSQRVNIIYYQQMINNFYPVDVSLQDGQSVNQLLLSNDPFVSPGMAVQSDTHQQQSA